MSAFTVDLYNRAAVHVAFPSRKATLRRAWRYIVTVKTLQLPLRTGPQANITEQGDPDEDRGECSMHSLQTWSV
jgi:hypothetical protein